MSVPARVTLVTLGVADVNRATAFYQALGWPLSGASVPGEVSFFKLTGAVLALWSEQALAADAAVPARSTGSVAEGATRFRGVSLAINVEDPGQVDAALTAAADAGGELVRAGEEADWGGYTGYFADPDGHLWEVAHNPAWPLGSDGLPVLP